MNFINDIPPLGDFNIVIIKSALVMIQIQVGY